MAVDVYLKSDIGQALAGALSVAVETTRANGTADLAHLAGCMTVTKGLALTFGVSWPGLLATVRGNVGAELATLLDQAAGVVVVTSPTRAALPYLERGR